jgi:hypothetical protein
VEDSRCPTGTTCLWAGDATVEVRITASGSEPAIYKLRLNVETAREISHAGFRVRLAAVAPHPTAGKTPQLPDYRITLLIRPI